MSAFISFKLFNLNFKLNDLSLKLSFKSSLKSKIKPNLSTKLENLSNLWLSFSKLNNMIIINLGANMYYLLNRDQFFIYIEIANKLIIVTNSQQIAVKGIDNILIIADNNYKLLITNINYISKIKITLLSLYKPAKKYYLKAIQLI